MAAIGGSSSDSDSDSKSESKARAAAGGWARYCELTGAGRGGIAVLALWGPGAEAVLRGALRLPGGDWSLEAGRPRVGRLGAGSGDEVVAVRLEAGEAPGGFEIQCHGGRQAPRLVGEALRAGGASEAGPGDWLRARGDSPSRAAGALSLWRAGTARAAEVLSDQAGGALDREVIAAREAARAGDLEGALEIVERLIGRIGLGRGVSGEWTAALAGRPNVGKSRLLNRLSGSERAIVSAEAGTTRDALGVWLSAGGWPVQVWDTAGVRETSDELEAAGVERARGRHAEADLLIGVLDRSTALTAEDQRLIAEWGERSGGAFGTRTDSGVLIVANKGDLAAAWAPPSDWGALTISAESGEGIEALVEEMGRRLAGDDGAGLAAGAGVPLTAEQGGWLREAREALGAGDRAGWERAFRELLEWGEDED